MACSRAPTWGVDDGQVGAELVLDLDDDFLGPELLLALQPPVLSLNVLLQWACQPPLLENKHGIQLELSHMIKMYVEVLCSCRRQSFKASIWHSLHWGLVCPVCSLAGL